MGKTSSRGGTGNIRGKESNGCGKKCSRGSITIGGKAGKASSKVDVLQIIMPVDLLLDRRTDALAVAGRLRSKTKLLSL